MDQVVGTVVKDVWRGARCGLTLRKARRNVDVTAAHRFTRWIKSLAILPPLLSVRALLHSCPISTPWRASVNSPPWRPRINGGGVTLTVCRETDRWRRLRRMGGIGFAASIEVVGRVSITGKLGTTVSSSFSSNSANRFSRNCRNSSVNPSMALFSFTGSASAGSASGGESGKNWSSRPKTHESPCCWCCGWIACQWYRPSSPNQQQLELPALRLLSSGWIWVDGHKLQDITHTLTQGRLD